jgi:hypothetical protein
MRKMPIPPALVTMVDALVLSAWLCVARHVIHDTPEAHRLNALSHSV